MKRSPKVGKVRKSESQEEVKGERLRAKGGSPEDRIKSQEPGARTKEAKGERLKAKGQEDSLESEVESPKSEEENSAIGISQSEITNSAIDIPQSALNKSEIEHPTSEIKNKSEIEHPTSERRSPLEHLEKTDNSEKIKNMEVHHHPEVEKKGIKEYLLEGLMIFIAVMMGFFAESIREHITDSDHEKQSIESLVKAVTSDTVQLHDVIRQATESINAIDSLMALKKLDLNQAGNKQKFYLFSLAGVINDTYFRSNDGALQQLNSSGTLRLISNRATVDSIFKYELLNKSIAAQEADDYFVFKETVTIMTKVEDLTMFQDTGAIHKRLSGAGGVQYTFTNKALPAVSSDKDLMQAYFNYASLYLATKSAYNYRLQKHLDFSRRLIDYLKTTYDIK
jgi:hypothetical protein